MHSDPTLSLDPPNQSIVGGLLRGWDRFWFTPMDPTGLALMRVLCGLVVFYVHLTYSWELFSYVGADGWVSAEVAQYLVQEVPIYALGWEWGDGLRQIGKGNYYWSIYHHVTDPGWIITLHVFALGCMALFTLGLWTRVTGALTWLAAMSYAQRASATVFGLDTMMMILLLYLMIGPSGATLSLDRWIEKWRARRQGLPEPEVQPSVLANFAIRLTQVHFCIIYLATGTSKLLGTTWWSGTSLNLVLLNSSFAPLDQAWYVGVMKFLATRRWLWETFVTGSIAFTLVVELCFPFLVWIKSTRWLMICGSVMLHTGIGVSMGLVTFSLMMMVMVLSFIPPEVIGRLIENVQSVFAGLLTRRAQAPAGELVLSR